MVDIQGLEFEVSSNSQQAANDIDSLSAALGRLKGSAQGGAGLNTLSKQLGQLSAALSGVSPSSVSTLNSFAQGLQTIAGVGNVKISSTIATQISGIGTAVRSLEGINLSPLSELANALVPLTTVGKTNLGGTLNQLARLPEISGKLSSMNMSAFAAQIQQVSSALAPLATQMNSISSGFSALPTKIQSVITGTNKLNTSMINMGNAGKSATSSLFGGFFKLTMIIALVRRLINALGKAIQNSMDFGETINLFQTAMRTLGKKAGEEFEYAFLEKAEEFQSRVSNALSLDPDLLMNYQATFASMASSMGLASETAYALSESFTMSLHYLYKINSGIYSEPTPPDRCNAFPL